MYKNIVTNMMTVQYAGCIYIKFSTIKTADINAPNSHVREIMTTARRFVIIEVYLNGYLMDKIRSTAIDNKLETAAGAINCESPRFATTNVSGT